MSESYKDTVKRIEILKDLIKRYKDAPLSMPYGLTYARAVSRLKYLKTRLNQYPKKDRTA